MKTVPNDFFVVVCQVGTIIKGGRRENGTISRSPILILGRPFSLAWTQI